MLPVLSSLVVAAMALALADNAGQAPATTTAPLVLGVKGTSFTVDGAPRFLVFVSYFDALDAAHLDEDLAWIAARADGVRIFPDWWDYDRSRRCATRFSNRTVLEARDDGTIGARPDRLARLKAVLDRAREAGLIVDLTFSYEAIRGSSRLSANSDGDVCGRSTGLTNRVRLDAYAKGVAEVAAALAGPGYRHVFFDLQNEWNGGWTRLSPEELRTLAQAVLRADPARLLTASAYDPRPGRLVGASRTAGLQLVTFHDWPRSAGWPDRVAPAIEGLRRALASSGGPLPVFAGEPPPETYGEGPGAFARGLEAARRAGAAGWTFHTRAGFRLDDGRLTERLAPDARTFLDGLARQRQAADTKHIHPASLGVD